MWPRDHENNARTLQNFIEGSSFAPQGLNIFRRQPRVVCANAAIERAKQRQERTAEIAHPDKSYLLAEERKRVGVRGQSILLGTLRGNGDRTG